MALSEAKRQVTHAKIGTFGPAGSGKTTLLAELAIAISKSYHNSAPVAFHATEPGVDYVIPMFEREGVKLYVERSKSFKDLLATARDAQKLGCCALIVDSITHIWVELVDAFCREKNIHRPEFQHWRIIKGNWADWANMYVNAPLHMLVAGRAGFEYEYEENADGKKELVKGDSKMKAEGEFGYEADLLVEMTAHSDKAEQRKARRGRQQEATAPRMVHTALVRKCRVWELNGKQFAWADRDQYKPGDYKAISDCFKPFLDFLNIGDTAAGPVVDSTRTSDSMFAGETNGEWHRKQQKKTILLEDWEATMSLLWPGQSAVEKSLRAKVGEAISGVRSKTAFESLPLSAIERAAFILRKLETEMKLKGAEAPATPESVLALLNDVRAMIENEEQQGTLGITGQDVAQATQAF